MGVGQAVSCTLVTPPAQTDNYFIYPATVNLEAKVLAFGGAVEKVEFLRDGVLLATKLEKPYQYTWQDAPKGRFFVIARASTKGGLTATSQAMVTVADLAVTLRARDTEFSQGLDALGAPAKVSLVATPSVHNAALDHIEFITSGKYADTPITAVRAIEQPVIELDAGLAGAALETEHLTVTGTAIVPSNSALTVNGMKASINEVDRFFVNDVALQPGSNTITLTLNSEVTQKSSQTIEVTSTGPEAFVVVLDRQEGLAPLRTNLIITDSGRVAFGRIEIYLNDSSQPYLTLTTLQDRQAVVPLQFDEPGTYTVTVRIYSPEGTPIYDIKRHVHAYSPLGAALQSVTIYSTFLGRLRSGNVDAAASLVGASMREGFRETLKRFQSGHAEIVNSLGSFDGMTITEDYAALRILRRRGLQTFEFEVLLAPGGDGIWRIIGM